MVDINLKGLGKMDMLKFKNLSKDREKIIRSSSSKPIETDFVTNQIASSLHPKVQHVKVSEIIKETNDVKTFILVPDLNTETKKLAYFKAGQYISVKVNIDGGIYRRPYTLSSSPKLALENKYAITIKRVENGIVSNYFWDHVQVGDTLDISAPSGEFCYERLRDANHVIALAGGSGITPFMSMAEAIFDGILDFQLTILYGVKTYEDIIFREKLDDITCKTDKIKVIYVLSEEDSHEFPTGFIDKPLIDKYLQEENSFFVCGPIAMYTSMNAILKEYSLPIKYIRHDFFMSEIDLKDINKEYSLTVLTQNKEITIKCQSCETLLASMERSGLLAPSKCHVGECGFCRSKLISGKVKTFYGDLRAGDLNFNYIHPCASFPESDVIIKLPN